MWFDASCFTTAVEKPECKTMQTQRPDWELLTGLTLCCAALTSLSLSLSLLEWFIRSYEIFPLFNNLLPFSSVFSSVSILVNLWIRKNKKKHTMSFQQLLWDCISLCLTGSYSVVATHNTWLLCSTTCWRLTLYHWADKVWYQLYYIKWFCCFKSLDQKPFSDITLLAVKVTVW